MRYAAALILLVFAAGVAVAADDPAAKCLDRQDHDAAVTLCTKAAEEGDAKAQYYLGVMYNIGDGVPKDKAKAVEWLTKAAEQGDAAAQLNLGGLYAFGEGVQQDWGKALEWFTKAAEQGSAVAAYYLGVMHKDGEGVPQDYSKALELLTVAAEREGASAQFHLGHMYAEGEGVPKDHVKAYMWLSLAGAQGRPGAQEGRDLVGEQMTPEQIAEAQQLASEWSPSEFVDPSGPLPLRAGVANVTNPVLIQGTRITPKYPELGRVARVDGQVILQAIIRKDGSVGDISVIRVNRPNLGFEEAAIAAVRQWRYEPARQDGKAVEVYFTLVIDFSLH